MKKIGSFLLAILLIVQLMIIGVFAAGEKLQFIMNVPADVNTKPGETFDVTIDLANNPGISSAKLNVEFDNSVLTLNQITVNTAELGGMATVSKTLTSPVTINWFNGLEDIADDMNYATLNFTVKADAEIGKTVVLDANFDPNDICDVNEENVEAEVVSASITVKGEEFGEMSLAGVPEEGIPYDGEAHTVSVTGLPEGASVSYNVNNVDVDADDNTISYTNAGTYKIVAEVTKTGFTPVELTGTLVIDKADLTISGSVEKVYDGKETADISEDDFTVTGVIGDDEVDFQLTENTVTINGSDVAGSPYSGTVALGKWTGADVENYNLPEEAEVSVTVTPKTLVVVINDAVQIEGHDEIRTSYQVSDAEGEGFVEADEDVYKLAGAVKVEGDKVVNESIALVPVTDNYELEFKSGKFTVVEKPEKVKITGKLADTDYFEGKAVDPTGLTVTLIAGDTEIEVDAGLLDTVCAPDVENDGTTVKIQFSFDGVVCDTEFEINVNKDDITAIEAVIADANKVVWVGDDVVIESVTATYESGKTAELDSSLYSIVCDTSAKTESATVTVSLNANTEISNADQTVTVIDKKLTGLEVVETTEGALSKVAGQTFAVSDEDVQINALYVDKNGNEIKVDVTAKYNDVTVTSDKAASVTKTLEYVDEAFGAYKPVPVKADLKVEFAAKIVTSVEVLAGPDITKYIEGTDFDLTGIVVKVTYNDGDSVEADTAEEFAANNITFKPETLELGDETVTVACGGKTASIEVTVIARSLTGIKVTVEKNEYVDGESFDKADITVKATYDNDDVETVTDYTVDADTFVLAVATEAETRTVTVTYGDKTDSYTVTVNPCVAINETTGERYDDLEEAFDDAEAGDEISLVIVDGDVDVDLDVEITITNNTGAEITITVNDEEITIADGESTEIVYEEENTVDDYYFFYMQMLQWRNRMYKITYKQTEGGTISGLESVRYGETVTVTVTPDEGYAIADVLVNGKSVGAVESYKIRSIKSNQTVSAVFEKIAVTSPFVDVDVDAPYFNAVLYVYENGIINGVSETEMVFAPNTTMTRAMFVTVLGRMSGVNMDDYQTVTFADCEAGSWYAPYVEWAAQAGIVTGYDADTFGPMDEITVEQAAVILYRYIAYMGYNTAADADLANYADGDQVSDWAAEQMKWALANGIYVSDATLDPQAPAVRSLVAEMLYNLSVWMG